MKHVRGVYERDKGSGLWCICWFDQFGKRHRESIGVRQLAIDAYRKRKTEVREGKLFPSAGRNRITSDDLFDDFSKAHPAHWSKGMLAIAKGWFKGRAAASITPQQIEERLNSLDRSPATANRYRAICSAVFSWAIRNNKLESNPARKVQHRKEHNVRVRFLLEKEEERLRKVIRKAFPSREAELDLALNTGMRHGEQYGLTWADVDFDSRFIALKRTKAGKPRYIPINEAAFEALRVLRHRNADRVCGPNTRKWFPTALKKAHIKDFHWHDLRHTFASRLAMKGANIRGLQELLGHGNIQMTMRYSHLMPGQTAEIVGMLDSSTATKTATASPKPETMKAKRTTA